MTTGITTQTAYLADLYYSRAHGTQVRNELLCLRDMRRVCESVHVSVCLPPGLMGAEGEG